MDDGKVLWAEVDEHGRLVLPAEVARQHGLTPGARLRVENGKTDMRLHRPVTHLAKVYVEPTSVCNLDCRMCMRHAWDEPLGRMSMETYDVLLAELQKLPVMPELFFGGLGEPLSHPDIIEMVTKAKNLGATVELITNGTLLTAARSRQLIAAGLDVLWVSIDGAHPESYADVRMGAELDNVIRNVARFRQLRAPNHRPRPQIGIAFVAMRRNINDLPEVLALGHRLGAAKFMVSNVMPYTEEMQADRLYTRVLRNITYLPSSWLPTLSLPKMDLDEVTREAFIKALSSGYNVSFAGFNLGGSNDVCTFIETGTLAVAWDGAVSPCLPLMHSYTSYLHGKPRHNRRHVVGRLGERALDEIWLDPEYVTYRETVQGFGFAPCAYCGGCDLSEANEEDCIGKEFPVCGGCLWAQALIQCP